MHESTIARVLAGEAPAEELEREDVEGGALIDDFSIEPEMLLRLVDPAERGALAPETLQAVAKAILDSDRFVWVDDVPTVAILYHWSTSQIDLALSRRSLTPRPYLDRPIRRGGPRLGYRVAMETCAVLAVVCFGTMLLGGNDFAEGTLGRHVMVVAAGFSAVMLLLVFVLARGR